MNLREIRIMSIAIVAILCLFFVIFTFVYTDYTRTCKIEKIYRHEIRMYLPDGSVKISEYEEN